MAVKWKYLTLNYIYRLEYTCVMQVMHQGKNISLNRIKRQKQSVKAPDIATHMKLDAYDSLAPVLWTIWIVNIFSFLQKLTQCL